MIRQVSLGIPDDADRCSGHADHRFRDDGDHDSSQLADYLRLGPTPASSDEVVFRLLTEVEGLLVRI